MSKSSTAIMPRSSGVMKGAITYAKFETRGEVPEDAQQKFMARIRTRAFRPLTPEDDDEVSVGWVPIERPYDEEISFRTDGVYFDKYLNLSMRIDAWRFPAALVKAKMLAAERAWRQKTGKERLTKVERAELRDLVERKLRRDGVPTTKVFDFSWDTDLNVLRFFGRSKTVLEHFFELFEKTFSMQLVPSAPYTLGMKLDLRPEILVKLKTVQPSTLHDSGVSGGVS